MRIHSIRLLQTLNQKEVIKGVQFNNIIMKKICALILCVFLATLVSSAQNAVEARKVLDKTASVIGRKGGACADFKIASKKYGNTSGSIAIKGNKFHASTPQAIVWFDGKTQWTYLKSTDEVNITNPKEESLAAMNPYLFINMYKSGFDLGMKSLGSYYQMHLVAQNKKRNIQEMYININKKTYVPSQVKMRQGTTWTTINITNFKGKDQSNKVFVFSDRDFPQAEIIDLR